MLPNFIIKILALIFIVYFVYLCYLDYRYREMKRRLILLSYPLVFYVNLVVCDNMFVTLLSSFILFISLYITCLFKTDSFGTIDILFAPLVTIWFNEYAFVYSLCLIIINSLLWGIGIVEKLFSRKGKDLSNPFLVTMFVTFLLFLILVPNNFVKIFSL